MEKQIINDFEKTFSHSDFSSNDIEIKKKYLTKFIDTGFPSRKNEDWKFSDLNQIISNHIGDVNFYNDNSYASKIDTSVFIEGLEHNKIVFVNGRIEKIDFSYEEKDKLEILDKNDLSDNFEIENSLVNLNYAFTKKHYKIVVKKNYCLKKPLIIYQIINNLKNRNINIRLDYKLEENSSIKLIDISNDNSEKNFINIINQFDLDQNAILKNYKLDKKRNNNIKYCFNNITQKSNSVSETFILSNGSKFIKHEVICNLNGKYASAFVNGILTVKDEQHHEIRTSINHLINDTKSYQLIKSVLNDQSKSVYQGKIFVDAEAQKTDGYQLSKAILLNEKTEFNAKPELEIYADDVKCSHGSASGDLNQSSIFYLMSRGLNYNQAREMLINGFLLDVVEKITDFEIRNLVKNLIGIKE